MNQLVLIVLSLLILLFLGAIFLFFYMRGLRSDVMAAWFDVLERLNVRLDKMPNLIETLRRLTQGQDDLFQAMIELRSRTWLLDQPDKERVYAELEVVGKFHETWELAKKFDDLNKDTNFLEVRTEVKEVSTEIDQLTTVYNTKARRYNKSRDFALFKPLALALGFKRIPVLEFE